MARRTREVWINEEGRDKNKVYLITEMSAFDTESWCKRLVNALVRNVNAKTLSLIIPLFYSYLNNINEKPVIKEEAIESLKSKANEDEINIDQATESIINIENALGINFFVMLLQLPDSEIEGLTKTLLNCCKHFTSYEGKVADDISNNPLYCEEPSTLWVLQKEAFGLHTDFFMNAVKQILPSLTAKITKK